MWSNTTQVYWLPLETYLLSVSIREVILWTNPLQFLLCIQKRYLEKREYIWWYSSWKPRVMLYVCHCDFLSIEQRFPPLCFIFLALPCKWPAEFGEPEACPSLTKWSRLKCPCSLVQKCNLACRIKTGHCMMGLECHCGFLHDSSHGLFYSSL